MTTEGDCFYRGDLKNRDKPCPWTAVNTRIKAQARVCHERGPDGTWTTGPDPGGVLRGGLCPGRDSGCRWGWAGRTSGLQAHVLTGPGNDQVGPDGRPSEGPGWMGGTGLCGQVREVRI